MKGVMKFGVLALFLVSLVGSAIAFNGGVFGNEVLTEALESGDYYAWKEAMISELNEERFNEMREWHAQNGEKMSERKAMMEEKNDAINVACEKGDISRLSEIGCMMMDKINEDNFETFCEFHQAKQDKDFKKVKELSEELGFEGPGKGFGIRGMHRMGIKHGFILE